MRTGIPSGSTSGAGTALTIVNTGSSRPRAVVLTELETEMPTHVEGPNIIYGVETAPTALAREAPPPGTHVQKMADNRSGTYPNTTRASLAATAAKPCAGDEGRAGCRGYIGQTSGGNCSRAFWPRSAQPSREPCAAWRCHTWRCGSDCGICLTAEWKDSIRRNSGTGDDA